MIMTTIPKTFHPSHLFLCLPSLLYSFKTHNISISINMGHLFSIGYYPILNWLACFLQHFTGNDCQSLINLFCRSQIFLFSSLHITPICPKIPQIHPSQNNFHYSIYLDPNLIFFLDVIFLGFTALYCHLDLGNLKMISHILFSSSISTICWWCLHFLLSWLFLHWISLFLSPGQNLTPTFPFLLQLCLSRAYGLQWNVSLTSACADVPN